MGFRKLFLVMLVTFISITSLSASAESLHSFAAPAYDARHGGQPVTLAMLLADPASYYRSDETYAKARAIIGDTMELKLTDTSFKKLLRSNRISVARCHDIFRGTFTLAAVDNGNHAYWTSRSCVAGEQILLLDGIPIMSLDCLNPIKLPEMDCRCGTLYYEWKQRQG